MQTVEQYLQKDCKRSLVNVPVIRSRYKEFTLVFQIASHPWWLAVQFSENTHQTSEQRKFGKYLFVFAPPPLTFRRFYPSIKIRLHFSLSVDWACSNAWQNFTKQTVYIFNLLCRL